MVLGGDGTPRVGEFAAGELGVLLGMTTTGARALMRDVLDLRHRHPRLWAATMSGRVRFFAARYVLRATRAAGLSLAQARQVDDRVAPFLGEVPWGRMQTLVETAVIEADPEAAEQRRLAAELARFVRTGRSSEYGTKTIYARARAGDAIFFFAMCDRIAQILELRGALEVAGRADLHPTDAADAADGDSALEMDVLRSEAIGILATPARALALIAWAEQHIPDDHRQDASDHADRDAGDGAPHPEPEPVPDPRAYLPPATLYVHISQESWLRQTRGVARVEDVGPVTIERAVDLLRHCQVTIRPVIDLNDNPAVDGYETSFRFRETVELRDPVEMFPHGTLSSRKADKDHTLAYRPPDEGGPPGQTSPDNLGPLGRYHHRLKTHGGWTCLQPEPGVYWWRTPHGHVTRVDPTGTHYCGRARPDFSMMEQHLRITLAA